MHELVLINYCASFNVYYFKFIINIIIIIIVIVIIITITVTIIIISSSPKISTNNYHETLTYFWLFFLKQSSSSHYEVWF